MFFRHRIDIWTVLPGYVPLLFRVVIFELLLDLVEAPLNSLSQHGLDL